MTDYIMQEVLKNARELACGDCIYFDRKASERGDKNYCKPHEDENGDCEKDL